MVDDGKSSHDLWQFSQKEQKAKLEKLRSDVLALSDEELVAQAVETYVLPIDGAPACPLSEVNRVHLRETMLTALIFGF